MWWYYWFILFISTIIRGWLCNETYSVQSTKHLLEVYNWDRSYIVKGAIQYALLSHNQLNTQRKLCPCLCKPFCFNICRSIDIWKIRLHAVHRENALFLTLKSWIQTSRASKWLWRMKRWLHNINEVIKARVSARKLWKIGFKLSSFAVMIQTQITN